MSVFKRDGALFYSYDFQLHGRRFSGSTRKTEKRAAEKFEADLKDKVTKDTIDPTKPLVFREARTLYWNEVGQHHANAETTLKNLMWLEQQIGAKALISEISDRMVAQLVAKRRGETVKGRKTLVTSATVNRTVLEPLSALLRRAEAVWNAKVQKIDWTRHTLPEPEERVREATHDEEVKLLAAIRGDYAPAVRFAILTGCRRAEIVGLTWKAVNFFARDFRVTGKGDRSRTIPMSQAVFDLLWSLRQGDGDGPVFTYVAEKTRDGRVRGARYPITLEGFKTAWRRGTKDAGVADFRFHDTRHTAATRLVRATGNLRLAQRLLGHSDVGTTTKYAHVTHEDLRAGLEAVDAASPVESPVEENERDAK